MLTGYWLWVSWREALLAAPVLAASIGLLDFIGARIKDLAARPRPCMAFPDIHQIEACGKTFGFPSNHAINTATAAAFFHVLYPRSGWVSWPLVALIGLSRVYIGAHYVTDVLGGWVIGGLVGAGVAWLLCATLVFALQWPVLRPRGLSDIDRSTAANDLQPSAAFSARKSSMYSSEYTSGFPGLRPCIWPHLLRLVTKAMSDRRLASCALVAFETA